MQHIRRISIAVLTILLLCALSSSTLAHSGKTDSNGGHYNKSTGEYHYHHGYSAHDHWDMDDDGDLDCPYNFDDQTNHHSNNNGGSDSNAIISPNYQSNTAHQNKQKDYTFSYMSIAIAVLFFVLVNCLAIYIDKKDNTPPEEPISLPSVLVSLLSTVIVFAVLFSLLFSLNQPIILKEISLEEMLEGLFISAVLSCLIAFFTGGATSCINSLLCAVFKLEVHGDFGHFQRLTIPLSYALAVFFFLLK